MSKQAFKRVRRALNLEVNREPLPAFVWPGGYPMFYLFADGGACCPRCANAEIVCIDGEMREMQRFPRQCRSGGFALAAAEVNWEDDSLTCDHCGERIESAYGE